MNCLVIVPFLNEERLLGVFLSSLAAQTRRPERLVLCDDGSSDGSPAIVAAFAAEHDWATVLTRSKRDPGRDRLRGAPELLAFLWALERTGGSWDVVAKMDADLELAPRHVETVMQAFELAPRLGIAGTFLATWTPSGATWIEPHPVHHVRGPTRFYRRACLSDISPIPVMLGWDGSDAVRARARGWETRSVALAGRQSVHLRPTGLHDGRLRAHARWGLCAYVTGTHPLGVLASAGLRARTSPRLLGGLAFVSGWLAAVIRRAPRAPVDIRRAKRAEDARRLRRGARRLLRA